jgi:hypothetical protein
VGLKLHQKQYFGQFSAQDATRVCWEVTDSTGAEAAGGCPGSSSNLEHVFPVFFFRKTHHDAY